MESQYVNKIQYTTYILDEKLKIIKFDDSFTKLTGYTAEDVKERELGQVDLIFPEDREEYFSVVSASLSETGEAYIEHRILRKDGSGIFVMCLGHNTIDEKTGQPVAIIRVTDMTKMTSMQLQAERIRRENNDEIMQLKEEIITDELTGILRRGAFVQQVKAGFLYCNSCTMLMIDVDDFKNINDTLGHAAGDEALKQVAEILRKTLRSMDIICRFGGDEFAVFLANTPGKQLTDEICKRIMDNIRPVEIKAEGKEPLSLTLSIGAVICNNTAENITFEDLYLSADAALYESKQTGKNRFTVRII